MGRPRIIRKRMKCSECGKVIELEWSVDKPALFQKRYNYITRVFHLDCLNKPVKATKIEQPKPFPPGPTGSVKPKSIEEEDQPELSKEELKELEQEEPEPPEPESSE